MEVRSLTRLSDLTLGEQVDDLEVQIVALDGMYQAGNLAESLYRATVHDGESFCKAVCRLDNPALPKDIAKDAAYSASGRMVLLDGRCHLELGSRVDPMDATALTAQRPLYSERLDLSLPEHRYGCLLLRTSQQGTLQALVNADQFAFAPLPVTEARYCEPQKAAAVRSLLEAAEIPRTAVRVVPGVHAVHLSGGPTIFHCTAAQLLPGQTVKRNEDWVWRDLPTAVNKAPRSWQHLLTALWGQLQGAAAAGIIDVHVPRTPAPVTPNPPAIAPQPIPQTPREGGIPGEQPSVETPPAKEAGQASASATGTSPGPSIQGDTVASSLPPPLPAISSTTVPGPAAVSPCRAPSMVPVPPQQADPGDAPDMRVPVCVVTGFAGSGKSALLQHLVSDVTTELWADWRGAVVVEEEMAAEALAWMQEGVPVVDLGKGLDAAAASLRQLFEEHSINYILLEAKATTIPQQVLDRLSEEPLCSLLRADSCVTCVDAITLKENLKALISSVADRAAGKAPASPLLTIVLQQIAAADVLLLSRSDLIKPRHVPTLVSAMVQMNSQAPIILTAFGQVDPRLVLHCNTQLGTESTAADAQSAAGAQPVLSTGLTTFNYVRHRPFDPLKLMTMLQQYFVVVEDVDDVLKDAGANSTGSSPSPDFTSLPPSVINSLRHAVESVRTATADVQQQLNVAEEGTLADVLGSSAAAAATCAAMTARASEAVQQLAAVQAERVRRLKQEGAHGPPQPPPTRGWSAARLSSAEATAVHNAKFATFGQLLRSKGCIWLATRSTLSGLWSHTGKAVAITPGPAWLAALAPEAWPQSEKLQRDLSKDFAAGIGDRRQELVFTGMGLNTVALAEALDSCLLPEAYAAAGAVQGPLHDPFVPWPGQEQDLGVSQASPGLPTGTHHGAIEPRAAAAQGAASAPAAEGAGGPPAYSRRLCTDMLPAFHPQAMSTPLVCHAFNIGGIRVTKGAAELQDLFESAPQGVACVYWHTPYTSPQEPLLAMLHTLCRSHPGVVRLFLLDVHSSIKNQQFGINSRVLKPAESRRPGAKPVPASGHPFPVVTVHELPLLHTVHVLAGPDATTTVTGIVSAMLAVTSPMGPRRSGQLGTGSGPMPPERPLSAASSGVGAYRTGSGVSHSGVPYSGSYPSSPPADRQSSTGNYTAFASPLTGLPQGPSHASLPSMNSLSKPPTPPPRTSLASTASLPQTSAVTGAPVAARPGVVSPSTYGAGGPAPPRSSVVSPSTCSAGNITPPRSSLTSPVGHSGLASGGSSMSLSRVLSTGTLGSLQGGPGGSRVTSPGIDDELENSGHVLHLRSGAGQLKQILSRAQQNNAMVVVIWLAGGYQERGGTPEGGRGGTPPRMGSASNVPSTLQDAVQQLATELRGTVFVEADILPHPLNKVVADKFKVNQFPTAQLFFNMALQNTLRRPAVRHLITALTQALESVQANQQGVNGPDLPDVEGGPSRRSSDISTGAGQSGSAQVSPRGRGRGSFESDGPPGGGPAFGRKKKSLGPPVPHKSGNVDYNPPRGWLTRGRAGETRQFPNGLGHYYPKMPCLRCGCPWWQGEDWDACCVRCGWDCEQDGYDNDSKPLPAFHSRWQQFTKQIAAGTTPAWPGP